MDEVDGNRQVKEDKLVKLELNGNSHTNAKMYKMFESKTMEQQAMLQEKVAEKLWDLRR